MLIVIYANHTNQTKKHRKEEYPHGAFLYV